MALQDLSDSDVALREQKIRKVYKRACFIAARLNKDTSTFRKALRYLYAEDDSHTVVGFETKKLMLDSISSGILDRSTEYNIVTAVEVEIYLGLKKHGVMSVRGLLALKREADQEDWHEIFMLAYQHRSKEKYPTERMIRVAVKEFYGSDEKELESSPSDRLLKKEKEVDSSDDSDDSDDDESDFNTTRRTAKSTSVTAVTQDNDGDFKEQVTDDDNQINRFIQRLIKRIKNEYSVEDEQLLLKKLTPTHRVDKDAANLVRFMDDDELEDFIENLENSLS